MHFFRKGAIERFGGLIQENFGVSTQLFEVLCVNDKSWRGLGKLYT